MYFFFLCINIISHLLQGKEFEVPVCLSCTEHITSISSDQTMANIKSLLCHHAKVATNIIRDFSNPMTLDGWLNLEEEEDDENSVVAILHKKDGKTTKTQHLAVVFLSAKNKTSLLFTTGKQVTPTCSSCSSVNCHCVRAWKRKLKKENDILEEDKDEEHLAEEGDVQQDGESHYNMKDAHYSYNISDIKFPLHSCPKQKAVFEKKQNGTFTFPQFIIPTYDENRTCEKHNNKFREDDNIAKLGSRHIILYHERGETIYEVDVYYRDSAGSCNCKQQFDGHEFMVLHIGGGKCVDYITLQSQLLSMVNSGTTTYGFHKTIVDNCKSLGSSFQLNYRSFLQACDGFVANLNFDFAACFSCTNCGINPKYFVGDGKADIAPLQRKLKAHGIKELSPHPDDKNILEQGSKHEDRMFLVDKKEREKICELLTESTDMSAFCSTTPFSSTNGKLVGKLISRLSRTSSEHLPDCYKVFLSDVCKNSPVAGYVQVTRNKPIIILKQFCTNQLDIRNGHHQNELLEVKSQLPAL